MLTVGLSELRSNLAAVTSHVIDEGQEVTVFKRNQPVFKLVPIRPTPAQDDQTTVDAGMAFIDQYDSVFERLAH